MSSAFLTIPSLQYKESFLAAVKEYQAEGLPYYSKLSLEQTQEFEAFVQKLADEAQGQNLPEGYVAHTTFWLVEGSEYIGRVDIRHELNEYLHKEGGHLGYDIRPSQRGKGYGHHILKLGLEKAKELGLEKILITCDVSNTPSKKVIEGNGGQLLKTQPVGEGKPDKALYWIET